MNQLSTIGAFHRGKICSSGVLDVMKHVEITGSPPRSHRVTSICDVAVSGLPRKETSMLVCEDIKVLPENESSGAS
jgi:hypothetical protein